MDQSLCAEEYGNGFKDGRVLALDECRKPILFILRQASPDLAAFISTAWQLAQPFQPALHAEPLKSLRFLHQKAHKDLDEPDMPSTCLPQTFPLEGCHCKIPAAFHLLNDLYCVGPRIRSQAQPVAGDQLIEILVVRIGPGSQPLGKIAEKDPINDLVLIRIPDRAQLGKSIRREVLICFVKFIEQETKLDLEFLAQYINNQLEVSDGKRQVLLPLTL